MISKKQCCPLTLKIEDCCEAQWKTTVKNVNATPDPLQQGIKGCIASLGCLIGTPLFLGTTAVTTVADGIYCTCCHLPHACCHHYGNGVVTITEDPESMNTGDRCLACISGIYWFCRWGGTIIRTR